jgi:hypothetical protein
MSSTLAELSGYFLRRSAPELYLASLMPCGLFGELQNWWYGASRTTPAGMALPKHDAARSLSRW